jgi:hypothetical protein
MLTNSRTVRIAIASPGDLKDVREAIPRIFMRWNNAHPNAHLLAKMWEFATPELGDHPQHLLNSQLLEESDLLIAMFWTRIGTPTPSARSGTIEEIREFVRRRGGSRAMLYFCTRPTNEAPLNQDFSELAALKQFQNEMRTQGLYYEFHSLESFERDVYTHLQAKVTALLQGNLGPAEIDKHSENVACDARLRQPIEFGASLAEIASGLANRMREINEISGSNNDNFVRLGAHILKSVASNIDRYVGFSGHSLPDESVKKIDRLCTRIKQLATDASDGDVAWSKFWPAATELSNDLVAESRYLAISN